MKYNWEPRHEYAIQAGWRWSHRVNVSITGTNTEWDNPRKIRKNDVGKLLLEEKSYRRDYENWTYERRYAHPGDASMLRDGWQSIFWVWWCTRSYVEFFPIEYTYFRWQWQSTRLAIVCRDAYIRTGGLAVPSTIPTTIQETESSAV